MHCTERLGCAFSVPSLGVSRTKGSFPGRTFLTSTGTISTSRFESSSSSLHTEEAHRKQQFVMTTSINCSFLQPQYCYSTFLRGASNFVSLNPGLNPSSVGRIDNNRGRNKTFLPSEIRREIAVLVTSLQSRQKGLRKSLRSSLKSACQAGSEGSGVRGSYDSGLRRARSRCGTDRKLISRRHLPGYGKIRVAKRVGGHRAGSESCFADAARPRSAECVETSSSSEAEEERCKQESVVADGSSSKGKTVTGRSRSSYTQKLSQKLGQQFRQTPPYSEDETDGSMPSSSLGPSSASGKHTSLKDQRASIAHRAKEATKDIRLTIQRVLEAHALMASKEQVAKDESSPTLTIVNVQKDRAKKSSMTPARGVLGGYKKIKAGKGWLFEDRAATEEDAVHDWGASLARRGPSKPLTNKGSLWRRDLGTLNEQQDLRKQSEIVQKVLGALSGVRGSTGITMALAEYVGRVTMSDLQQVLHELGIMKDWLTALQLFDWMHTMVGYKPDETIYHTMILLLANARRMDVAEAIFEGLVKEGMEQRHQEYTVLLTGYVRSGSLQRAVTILERMKKAGICPQVSAYNILIDGCSKSAKGLETAALLLEQMRRDNVASDRSTYTSTIIMYCRKGRHQEATDVFEQMRLNGCIPDKVTYKTILNAYSKLGEVKGMMDVHRLMMEQGVEQDSVSYNIVLNTLTRMGRIRDVGRYWALMRKGRISPDLTTCSILINAFGRAREWDEVDIVLLEMERIGLQADLTVYNSLLSVYGKAGLLFEVELIVKSLKAESSRLVEHGNSSLTFDLITYNTLLDIYGKAGRLNDVIHWFSEMKKAGVQPDVKTFNSLVNAYGKASHFDGVKEVLELFQKHNYKPDLVFYNTLLFMFGRVGHYEDAWQILGDMKQASYAPTLETYNSLILVFGRGNVQEGLKMFTEMIEAGVQPNSVTFKLLMDIHAKKGLVKDCLRIYYESPNFLDDRCDESLLSSAVGACCNMHCIEEAEELLIDFESHGLTVSLACYNWLILGYGKKGQWQEAENVFNRMKEKNITPNAQSLSFLLEAYSLSGQIPKGEAIIVKLKEQKLIPDTAGYNALLRFYTRTGDIPSAFQIYELLQTRGPKLNQSSFVPMIEVLAQEGAVDERFWGIIRDLENAPFQPKYIIHSAMLMALAKCGQKPDAVPLTIALERLGCSQDICALLKESGISKSGPNKGLWERLSALFGLMDREGLNIEVQRAFHNALIDALWSFEYEMRALKVTELSVAHGIFGLDVCQWKAESWTLDVRYAAAGAAQILLLTWLAGIRQAIKSAEKVPPKVRILLAWEWQLRTGENWGARDAVSAHLSDLKAPFVLVKEGQELEAPGGTMRTWLLKDATAEGLVFNSKE